MVARYCWVNIEFFSLLSGSWWQLDDTEAVPPFSHHHPTLSAGTTHPAPVPALNLLCILINHLYHRIAVHLRHTHCASYISMKFVFLIISVWALFWDRFYFISHGLHVAMWHFLEIRKIIAVSLEAVSEWLYPAILLLSGLTESLIALIDFPENVVQKPSLFSVMWWIPVIELVHSV